MNHVRTAAFAATLAIGTLIVAILISPTIFLGEQAVRRAVKVWARFALFSLRMICGVRHRIEGREFIPTGGALVAVNHQSMWETVALMAILEKPVLVFKKELVRVPVYGWWALKAGCIPVDREAGVKALNALTRAARGRIESGCQVVVFPEGTRARVGERLPLQPGVASIYMATKAPCTPAVHDSGRFWRPPGGVTALKVPGVITLRFLPAIAPGLPRKAFMAELTALLRGDPLNADKSRRAAKGAAA